MLQDSLIEQVTRGFFTPYNRDNIFTTTIGKPKHLGCVHCIGGA